MFRVFKFVQLLQRNIISIDLIPCDSRCKSIPHSSFIIIFCHKFIANMKLWRITGQKLTSTIDTIRCSNFQHELKIEKFTWQNYAIRFHKTLHLLRSHNTSNILTRNRRHCCDCQHTLPVLTSHSSLCAAFRSTFNIFPFDLGVIWIGKPKQISCRFRLFHIRIKCEKLFFSPFTSNRWHALDM